MLFDEPYYLRINEARWTAARALIHTAQQTLPQPLRTCLDVGSGPGWFSERLISEGLEVEAWEGRAELASEAARRVPQATVRHLDIEAHSLDSHQPAFDLVFCFGFLYHIENPLKVVKRLHRLTKVLLLLETVIVPFEEPVFRLTYEGKNETQGLTHRALVPSEAAVVATLQSSGFAHVYSFDGDVAHEDFRESADRHKRRRIFAASHESLSIDHLTSQGVVAAHKYDYSKTRQTPA